MVAYAPLSDATLQRGDAIMTPAGFLVFKGVAGAPHGAGDFTALTKAAMPASRARRSAVAGARQRGGPPSELEGLARFANGDAAGEVGQGARETCQRRGRQDPPAGLAWRRRRLTTPRENTL